MTVHPINNCYANIHVFFAETLFHTFILYCTILLILLFIAVSFSILKIKPVHNRYPIQLSDVIFSCPKHATFIRLNLFTIGTLFIPLSFSCPKKLRDNDFCIDIFSRKRLLSYRCINMVGGQLIFQLINKLHATLMVLLHRSSNMFFQYY